MASAAEARRELSGAPSTPLERVFAACASREAYRKAVDVLVAQGQLHPSQRPQAMAFGEYRFDLVKIVRADNERHLGLDTAEYRSASDARDRYGELKGAAEKAVIKSWWWRAAVSAVPAWGVASLIVQFRGRPFPVGLLALVGGVGAALWVWSMVSRGLGAVIRRRIVAGAPDMDAVREILARSRGRCGRCKGPVEQWRSEVEWSPQRRTHSRSQVWDTSTMFDVLTWHYQSAGRTVGDYAQDWSQTETMWCSDCGFTTVRRSGGTDRWSQVDRTWKVGPH